MAIFRIALANIRFPPSPAESVTLAVDAVRRASVERADLVCFPECYVSQGAGERISRHPFIVLTRRAELCLSPRLAPLGIARCLRTWWPMSTR
jgi:hypothetical protein